MGAVVSVDQLRQAQGAGHTGWASADDYHIGFHLWALDPFERFTKNKHSALSRQP
jgi:hypothetical protein